MSDEQHRQTLWSLLGELPQADSTPSGVITEEVEHDGFTRQEWLLDLNGEQQVPATLLIPNGITADSPAPAILYNHAHGGRYGLGRREVLAGRPTLQDPPWGEVLSEMGFITLVIDTWAFGDRAGESESAIFKRMIWTGQVMWGRMLYDNVRALDWLIEREDVDASRIGTMGISMGSTMAWWHAALDERILLCVDLCCMTDMDTMLHKGTMDGHGIYYYVPDLLLHSSTAQINALIAPRPHLCCAGLQDDLTPPEGLERVDATLKEAYAAAGSPENWLLYTEDVGHTETTGMRRLVKQWLERHLQ